MNCLSGRRPFSFTGCLLIALFAATPLLASDQPPPLPSEQQRLISIARLWVAVKYFHPYLASRPIDWDKALVDALPALRTAATEAEFSAAVQSLLAPLGDPLTHVTASTPSEVADDSGAIGQRSWIHHGLPSALPGASAFYQAFVVKPGLKPETVSLTLTAATTARIRLSEPVSLSPSSSPVPKPAPELDYANTPFPPVELRILSAFRIWGAIHNFFGYKDLMDEDWDAVFADSLPKFVAAKDARGYHLAVAEMISRLSDSNSSVESHELDQYFGEASLGLKIRLIEKKPVVTRISDPAVKAAGLQLGDIITAVDGERLADRIKREANYLSASTAQALSALVVERLLDGPDESSATLNVAGVDDRSRTVVLKRSVGAKGSKAPAESQSAMRVLSTNIGYVDLGRLSSAEVNAMFEKLRNTAAIIFDARGPVAPLTSEIASCLAKQPGVTTAIVTGPLALQPDLPRPGVSTSTSSYFSMEAVRASCPKPYKGKTVMLIDERTIGNAEHLGLAMEAANNTEFLGTPSAGADSAITEFSAPGGILIRFSGQDIRHSNGGPIQRMGLQPSLVLAPKIAAIRAGRDVVLEKAIEYLRPPATQARLYRRPTSPGVGNDR